MNFLFCKSNKPAFKKQHHSEFPDCKDDLIFNGKKAHCYLGHASSSTELIHF